MFTPEEFNATVQAFSQPINPLHDGVEQYTQLLKSVLKKMQTMIPQSAPDPFPGEPLQEEAQAAQASG